MKRIFSTVTAEVLSTAKLGLGWRHDDCHARCTGSQKVTASALAMTRSIVSALTNISVIIDVRSLFRSGAREYLRRIAVFFVALTAVPICVAQPVVSAVLNGVTFDASLSPGCWTTIFGRELSGVEMSASSVPLPTTLADVKVAIGGLEAPLGYVGPGQINVLMPFELVVPDSGVLMLTVTNSEGTSDAFALPLGKTSPGLFTVSADGRGPAHIFTSAFEPVTAVEENDFVITYAACLGVTEPAAVSAAGGVSQEPFNRPVNDFKLFVGEKLADVDAVLAPGFPGVFQVNATLGALGSNRIYIESAGIRGNAATVNNVPGQNVTNVSGSIESFYPPTNPTGQFPGPTSSQAFSAAPEIGSFSVEFEILPNAKPFTVAAVGDAGSAIIRIDPVSSTFSADVILPSLASRNGDFSNTEFDPLWDLLTCGVGHGCASFVENMIPNSRFDPTAFFAVGTLPVANTDVPGRSSDILHLEGVLVPGAPFRIDAENNAMLTRFGGYDLVPFGPFPTATANYQLFVDGAFVASNETEYDVMAYPVP